jgi:hypothetical protein
MQCKCVRVKWDTPLFSPSSTWSATSAWTTTAAVPSLVRAESVAVPSASAFAVRHPDDGPGFTLMTLGALELTSYTPGPSADTPTPARQWMSSVPTAIFAFFPAKNSSSPPHAASPLAARHAAKQAATALRVTGFRGFGFGAVPVQCERLSFTARR